MSLSFLIDMNLPPDWTALLRLEGWSAVHWADVGDLRATDTVVMDYARANGHVVFTHDLDFGAILARTRAAGPSVIQVRTQDVMPEALGPLVVAAIRSHGPALEAGALMTVDEAAMRVRLLPIG